MRLLSEVLWMDSGILLNKSGFEYLYIYQYHRDYGDMHDLLYTQFNSLILSSTFCF